MVLENFQKFQIEESVMRFLKADLKTMLQPEKLCTYMDLGWISECRGKFQNIQFLVSDLKMVPCAFWHMATV